MTLAFKPLAGQARISVTCINKEPRTSGQGSGGTGQFGKVSGDPDHVDFDKFGIRGLGVEIRIRPPRGRTIIRRLKTTGMSGQGPQPSDVTIDIPAAHENTTWKVTVKADQPVRSEMNAGVSFVKARHLLRTTVIPVSLLNGAASEVLKGLSPQIVVDRGTATIDLSDDLAKHAGGGIPRKFKDSRLDVIRDLELRSVGATVKIERQGSTRVQRVVFEVIARFGNASAKAGPLEVRLEGAGEGIGVRTRFEIFHRKGTRNLGYKATVKIGLVVGGTSFAVKSVQALVDFAVNPVLIIAELFGVGPGRVDVEGIVKGLKDKAEVKAEKFLNEPDVRTKASRFVTDGLLQLCQRGHVLHEFKGDGDNLVIKHFDPRVHERVPPQRVVVFDEPADQPEPTQDDIDGARVLNEKIDHIVCLMMENRSFDHLLGYLKLDNVLDGVDGLEKEMSNGGIGIEEMSETRFEFSPGHQFEEVAEQINGGRMDGFVRDFHEKHGEDTFIDRVNPMGYYNGATLPAYRFLAENYLVCDHWFCSHPGPTWPNRFCTFAGRTPEIDNLDADDERIGYVNLGTVFDRLRPDEWVVYEHDISFLRMFDRYRLDTAQIRPFNEFFDRAETGLPLFTFIEPDYTDVVPGDRIANDDHPPADLRQGQRLLQRVYNAIQASPNWQRTMLIITYDEHGGFFDHVAPPGTKENPDDAIAPVHPEGRLHLGPRVPSLVISPWVPNGASHQRLEHTSIAKTVLLRRFGRRHPSLGPRVQQSANLGLVLTNRRPRLNIGPMPPIDAVPEAPPFDIGPKPGRDFHEGMRRFAVPSR